MSRGGRSRLNPSWPYYTFVKGLAEYRAGHFADAVEWLRRVAAPDDAPARQGRLRDVAMAAIPAETNRCRPHALAQESRLAEIRECSTRTSARIDWNDPIIAQSLTARGPGGHPRIRPGAMTKTEMSDVTQLLDAIEHGDPKAAGQLLPLVYEEFRKLAACKMANEAPGQTLQPTALVHEAWLTAGWRRRPGMGQPRALLRRRRRSDAPHSHR